MVYFNLSDDTSKIKVLINIMHVVLLSLTAIQKKISINLTHKKYEE
jgi:hypothetical protein